MPDHYYSENPESAHKPRVFTETVLGNPVTFHTDAGVFSRDGVDVGSRLLLETAAPLTGHVLDMGAGWGAVGISIAKSCPEAHVLMAEINTRALELIHKNMSVNGVTNAEAIQSDGFSAVTGSFDAILTNPPIRAGKQVIYKMFADAADHLTENGVLYIVIRKQQGAPSALKYVRSLYETAEVTTRDAGFWIIACSHPLKNERT